MSQNQGYLLTAALYAAFAAAFALGKDRVVCRLIAGFNDFPPEKQAEYDTEAIAADYRNMMLELTAVFIVCGLLARWTSHPLLCTLAAFGIMLVLVLRGFHLDPYEAFRKYRKDNSVQP